MAGERTYGAVEVVGRAAGINQAGWEGAIADNECAMLWNMTLNRDGEWGKRQGYTLAKAIVIDTAVPPALKLHWHTDETTDQATGATWVETGDEVTAASSGALDVGDVTGGVNTQALDGETVSYVGTTALTSFIKIPSSFNFDIDAGRLTFWFRVQSTSPGNGFNTDTASFGYCPGARVFTGSANFYITCDSASGLKWKYGSGASEYIILGHIELNTWNKVDIRWDNTVGATIYPYRYQAFLNSVSTGTADPASAVTTSFDASVYFLNSGSAGSDAIYLNRPAGDEPAMDFAGRVSLISSWSSSVASAVVPPAITGIHNNSSQQRAIITAGIASPAAGKVFYSPSWTQSAPADAVDYDIAGVRTAATECQGNLYITDGSTTLHYLVGSATTTTEYTLPEAAKWIEEYHGHLCLAGLGTNGAYSVRLSTLDDFVTSSAVSWPSTNQIFKCRDVVRGIKAFAGQLIVGTRSTIEAISGYQPHDFAKTIVANTGCASHWSMKEIALMDGTTPALMWAGYDGIYMLVGGAVQKMTYAIQDFWDTLSKVEIEESHAVDCRERGEYMIAVSDGTGGENNFVLVYNYRTKGDWSIYRYANRMDVLGKYYRNGREVILGGDSNGNLYELNLGDSDYGAAINGYILTKWHDGGLPDADKDFRRLYVWVEALGDYDIEVGWSVNYVESIVEPSVIVGTNGNDYTCITSHEPSVVVGTDAVDYYCTDAHIAASANCPTTGGSYASFWTATGTTGRGTTWAADSSYASNDDKKPITGEQYSSYWVAKNTIGEGEAWGASAGYVSEDIGMETNDVIPLNVGLAKFGVAVFGTDVFASGITTKVYGFDLHNARGRSIQFMFRTKNADEPFSIRGYKAYFTYIPEFPA